MYVHDLVIYRSVQKKRDFPSVFPFVSHTWSNIDVEPAGLDKEMKDAMLSHVGRHFRKHRF